MEGKSLKVKEANSLLACILKAIIINDGNSDKKSTVDSSEDKLDETTKIDPNDSIWTQFPVKSGITRPTQSPQLTQGTSQEKITTVNNSQKAKICRCYKSWENRPYKFIANNYLYYSNFMHISFHTHFSFMKVFYLQDLNKYILTFILIPTTCRLGLGSRLMLSTCCTYTPTAIAIAVVV